MGERDDQQLIAAYRAGDDAAFGRIHDRHRAALERYARKVLGRSPSTPRTSCRRRCCARAGRCGATSGTSSCGRGCTG